jgi:hypothetical protein
MPIVKVWGVHTDMELSDLDKLRGKMTVTLKDIYDADSDVFLATTADTSKKFGFNALMSLGIFAEVIYTSKAPIPEETLQKVAEAVGTILAERFGSRVDCIAQVIPPGSGYWSTKS